MFIPRNGILGIQESKCHKYNLSSHWHRVYCKCNELQFYNTITKTSSKFSGQYRFINRHRYMYSVSWSVSQEGMQMCGSLMWYRAEDRLQRHYAQYWNWFLAYAPKSYSSGSGTTELSKGHTAGTGCPFFPMQLANKFWRSLWVMIYVTPRFDQ